jgi:glutamate-1-semialdehyde 2,1-aminomutase
MAIKLSRREMLVGAAVAPLVMKGLATKAGEPAEPNAAELLQVNELDRRIWQEELDAFVPARLYDMHTHLSRAQFNLDPKSNYTLPGWADPSGIFDEKGSLELLTEVESLLNPGRQVEHLLMPDPYEKCDFTAANDFIAAEAKKKPGTRALMVVHPRMTADEVEKEVVRHRFVGFKPYLWYAPIKDMWEARIPDFMPEHQIAIAHRYGLIIGLHLSKKRAIADPENLDDLERLTEKYPRARWILYHNARSYYSWAIEESAPRLRRLHNTWIEGSSVCESAAFDATFSTIPSSRVMYGTDDFPVGVTRGKYLAWGYAWSQMDRHNQTFQVRHCDGRMTFVRYEMLRAMRRAAKNQQLSRQQIEDVFYNNAERLVNSAWKDLNDAMGSQV